MKLLILLSTLYVSVVFSLPAVTNSGSLVVSSTEAATEEQITNEDQKENAPIVPKIYEMKIDTNVTNRFAKTLITSKVKNLAKTAQEATFAVILPETAYISGFVMEINGKSYEAYIQEKEEAKKTYDQAVSSGLAAAHVHANARDSNRFTVSVNVEPQSKAVFKLTYEELLQRQNEQYEVVINIHPGQPVKDLSVEVHINETRPLKFVKSPPLRSGNEISKNDDKLETLAKIEVVNSTTATVNFNPDIEKQKQFASGLGTDKENGLSGQFVVQYDVERDPKGGEVLVKDGYFVHFFAPSEIPPLPKQVVFVLDTSGSMGGIRIKQLKEAMNSILEELKKEDVFNIVEFSSTVKVWNIENASVQYEAGEDPWAVSRENEDAPKQKVQTLPPTYAANENNIKKAKEVIEKLDANGGTDIETALRTGLKIVKKYKEDNKESVHQPIIIFLTDGEPTVRETSTEKIISNIHEANSGDLKSPIFSLSFGDGADRDFLQKISLKNLGFARHIYEAADASLQLQEFYKQISSPLLSNVTFKYVSNVTKQTKTHFPIFFDGAEFVVAGEIPLDVEFSTPAVYGSGRNGFLELLPVNIEKPVGSLERLWAYLTVKQILEDRDAAENKTSYTAKALELSLKYSFVTPVTSLVVVKPNDTAKAVDTEDASKGHGEFPHYLSVNSPGLAGFPGAGGGFGAPVPPNSPIYDIFVLSGPSYDVEDLDSSYPYSLNARGDIGGVAPTLPPPYFDLATKLPFLNSILSDAGFVITIPGIRPFSAVSSSGVVHRKGAYRPLPTTPLIFGGTPIIRSTTTAPALSTTTHIKNMDIYEETKLQLPWLNDILSENNVLSQPSGGYVLKLNETLKDYPKCSNAPSNATESHCTLLSQCTKMYPVLKNVQTFIKHFCPLENQIAGICCPDDVTSKA